MESVPPAPAPVKLEFIILWLKPFPVMKLVKAPWGGLFRWHGLTFVSTLAVAHLSQRGKETGLTALPRRLRPLKSARAGFPAQLGSLLGVMCSMDSDKSIIWTVTPIFSLFHSSVLPTSGLAGGRWGSPGPRASGWRASATCWPQKPTVF